jgi:hypothetical protein
MWAYRAQVGVKTKPLTDSQQPLFWANWRCGIGPTWTSNCTKEDGRCSPASGDRFLREWIPCGIDRRAAYQGIFDRESVPISIGHGIEHLDPLCDDLSAGPIAGQYDNVCIHYNSLILGFLDIGEESPSSVAVLV